MKLKALVIEFGKFWLSRVREVMNLEGWETMTIDIKEDENQVDSLMLEISSDENTLSRYLKDVLLVVTEIKFWDRFEWRLIFFLKEKFPHLAIVLLTNESIGNMTKILKSVGVYVVEKKYFNQHIFPKAGKRTVRDYSQYEKRRYDNSPVAIISSNNRAVFNVILKTDPAWINQSLRSGNSSYGKILWENPTLDKKMPPVWSELGPCLPIIFSKSKKLTRKWALEKIAEICCQNIFQPFNLDKCFNLLIALEEISKMAQDGKADFFSGSNVKYSIHRPRTIVAVIVSSLCDGDLSQGQLAPYLGDLKKIVEAIKPGLENALSRFKEDYYPHTDVRHDWRYSFCEEFLIAEKPAEEISSLLL